MMKSLFLYTSLLCLSFSLVAQLKLPAIFSDNMVLQRNTEVKIWGWEKKGAKISITPSWSEEKYDAVADKDGTWQVSIETPESGGPFSITVASKQTITLNNVLIGDVWLCAGQSNMEIPMKGYLGEAIMNSKTDILKSTNSNIRYISVPRQSTTVPTENFDGEWLLANTKNTGEFSAVAYYFARLINEITEVPIGLVDVTYGGSNAEAWMSEKALSSIEYKSLPIPTKDDEIKEKNRTPAVLYNGMLKPVVGYTITGAIWYQGESNASRPIEYETVFPKMVEQWRSEWKQGDFPFYFTQIAPFNYDAFYPNETPWYANAAYLRDAQRKALQKISNSGMACLLDAGEMMSIHPKDKQTPGERLAYLALAEQYHIEGLWHKTPDYNELNIEDSLITITFKNLPNGITSYGKKVTAFEIAGADQVFYPANCKVRKKSVQVWSENVPNPKAVRYAFTNEGPAQLFSTDGLPVTSFRTDDWQPELVKFSK